MVCGGAEADQYISLTLTGGAGQRAASLGGQWAVGWRPWAVAQDDVNEELGTGTGTGTEIGAGE